MTNTALKAQIDSQITNETTANAITPTDVGTNLKAVVDYVDQQLPYKVYSAFLQFVDGSTITPTVLANTIGDGSGDGVNDIAWSYNTSTQPKAVMTDAPFLSGKCVYIPTIYFQSDLAFNLKGARASDSEFRLFSSEVVLSTPSLAYVSGVYVEIRIYN